MAVIKFLKIQVKPEFVFKGYSDEARTNPINATHPAEIGDTIYTEMSVKDNIFKRFKFHMRQFTAFPDDTRNSTGVHFDLVDVSNQHFLSSFYKLTNHTIC